MYLIFGPRNRGTMNWRRCFSNINKLPKIMVDDHWCALCTGLVIAKSRIYITPDGAMSDHQWRCIIIITYTLGKITKSRPVIRQLNCRWGAVG